MPEYTLAWESTPEERYDTDMTERARAHIMATKAKVIDDFGGSGGDVADNGFDLVLDDDAKALTLAQKIATEVAHDVVLSGDGFQVTIIPSLPAPA